MGLERNYVFEALILIQVHAENYYTFCVRKDR